MKEIEENAAGLSDFLKGLANPQRLLILCQLTSGEKSVGDLVEATGIAQTSMSQHLAKLKKEGIVSFRRDHRVLYYSIAHDRVPVLMQTLGEDFCKKDQ